jgi:hypothetical protein
MEDSGILYVLTNPFMPGLVKVGCTTGSVEDRIYDLSSSTGVPVAFQCHFAARVTDMATKEKTLHQLFLTNVLIQEENFSRLPQSEWGRSRK